MRYNYYYILFLALFQLVGLLQVIGLVIQHIQPIEPLRAPNIIINNNLSDYLGFTKGIYPPAASLPQLSNYSILSNKPPPIAAYVNSIIIHSSLVNNNVVSPSDILDAFQISNATFGQNINYTPNIEKYVKLTKGVYNSMILYFTDQNNNPITLLDPNILITLLLKKKSK